MNPIYYEYPHAEWWLTKQNRAREMTDNELHYARMDCNEAARICGRKTEGKYRDEGSIYRMEQIRREAKQRRYIKSLKDIGKAV